MLSWVKLSMLSVDSRRGGKSGDCPKGVESAEVKSLGGGERGTSVEKSDEQEDRDLDAL